MLHSVAHFCHELKALISSEFQFIASVGDWHPLNMLHHKVWSTVFSNTCFVDLRNARVIHDCKCLSFCFKPSNDLLGIHARLDDFECYSPFHWLALFSQIHNPHSAFAKDIQYLERANRIPALVVQCGVTGLLTGLHCLC